MLAGELFNDGLTAAGFKADVQYAGASSTSSEQQNQISAMVTKGAKVIVIGATDGSQLGTQVKAAKDAGATVIAYDRLITNTPDRRLLRRVRQLQGRPAAGPGPARRHEGQEGRTARTTSSCSPARRTTTTPRSSSTARWRCSSRRSTRAPSIVVLRPERHQADRHPGLEGRERAEAHGHAADLDLHGARRSTASSRRTTPWPARSSPRSRPPASRSRSSPVRTPRSSRSSRSWRASSTPRSTRTPATWSTRPSPWSRPCRRATDADVNDTKSYNNGVKVVPAYLLPPVIVTKENAAEAYANDPKLAPLTK